MGLFDWLGKREPKATVPLPKLCYDVAYFILPPNVYNDTAQFLELLRTRPAAGGELYALACQTRKSAPVKADAERFAWHFGQLMEGKEYLALEFPVPPPVDFLNKPPGGGLPVLAPHFSAIIRDTASGAVEYFVLGQAPMDGGTTLRCVTRDGANCNLGPGPEPKLEAFLDAVREWITRAPAG